MGDALGKIRDNVKFVQASESRGKLFASCVDSVGINLRAGLTLDVSTRWNSTFKMLDRAIKYRFAFDSYQGIDPIYKFLPTRAEWDLGIQICELLQPFDEITNLISGSTYPTSNLYFMQVYKIEYWLRAHEDNGEHVIFEMVEAMKAKFDKYWHDYSEILAMAAACDPRFKLSLLEFCFTNLDPSTSQQKVDNVKDKLNLFFKAYSKPTTQSSQSVENLQEAVAGVGDSQSHGKAAINYNDFNNFRKKNVTASGKSALDLYLDEPPIDVEMFASLNVLDYWKDNFHRFDELSRMACDLLSIPITTVASKSSFSIGSRVLNKYRSCLLPRNVQALICARNWLRGFEPYDESESGEVHGEDENLPSIESSTS
ncbi:Zinc finger BED domain-containing protein DAYSLEEPER [Cardamine amara subsp. amara]|uniref:Zinc finger BED domain-containing protein DAYSLEEPER n=1 Tax=Cardamine amara subsp. amara TaxID=228776 RepID=A0ABD0ZNN1_CARAN